MFHSMSSSMRWVSHPASLPSSETLLADQELLETRMDDHQSTKNCRYVSGVKTQSDQ